VDATLRQAARSAQAGVRIVNGSVTLITLSVITRRFGQSPDGGNVAATKVTFILHAPGGTPRGQAASGVVGTRTDVTQAGECGHSKAATSVQTLNSTTPQPSWWNGTCDNGDTSTAPPADGGPLTSSGSSANSVDADCE
jgi:hypothetical protein